MMYKQYLNKNNKGKYLNVLNNFIIAEAIMAPQHYIYPLTHIGYFVMGVFV